MRPVLSIIFATLAGAASAGSYTPSGTTTGGAYRCTDYSTATFDVRFAGPGCTLGAVDGRAVRGSGVLQCVVDGASPGILTISHRDTFSLQNRRTGSVIDGQCRRI